MRLVRPRSAAPAALAVALALALPATAQEAAPSVAAATDTAGPEADEAPPPGEAGPAALASAVVWAPAPDLVVAVADSAALAAFVAETEAAAETGALVGVGRASYYGERFRGRRTASGERFDPDALTAAHRTLPFGTRLRVTNLRTGQAVVVRVTDRGPFHGARVLDLSKEAARRIGMLRSGTARVRIERL